MLLAVLRLGERARAVDVRRTIEQAGDRRVTRGALYATLERLEGKGLVEWEVESTTPARGGIPRRRFRVTQAGLAALRRMRRTVARLSEGLDGILDWT